MDKKNNQVAVYGSLKKDFPNSRLLSGAEFLGEDVIRGWTMYSLGGFPGIVAGNEEEAILVEVYKVNDNEFSRLDMLEGYPSFYNRKQVPTKLGSSWIYYLSSPENYTTTHDVVTSGIWGDAQ